MSIKSIKIKILHIRRKTRDTHKKETCVSTKSPTPSVYNYNAYLPSPLRIPSYSNETRFRCIQVYTHQPVADIGSFAPRAYVEDARDTPGERWNHVRMHTYTDDRGALTIFSEAATHLRSSAPCKACALLNKAFALPKKACALLSKACALPNKACALPNKACALPNKA